MPAILLFIFIPVLLGAGIGYRRGRTAIESRKEALYEIGMTALIAAGWIIAVQLVLTGAFASAAGLGFSMQASARIIGASALIWLPVTIIAFLFRATRSRRT